MKQIKIIISPEGDAKVEAIGFTGTACNGATKPIEEALGQVVKDTPKPEQYAQNSNPQTLQRNGW